MEINQLKFGAILSYISMGIGYVVSILFTPIMLRLLGQSEFGLYNLVASIISYLGILHFGFGSAYIRYYSRYRVLEDRNSIASLNGMSILIFSLLGLVAIFAGLVLAANTEFVFGSELSTIELVRSSTLMYILTFRLAFSFPGIVFNSYITANENFIYQRIIQLISVVINPFIILPLLLLGFGSVGLAISTVIIGGTFEVINALYCLKKLKMDFSFKNINFSLMKEMMVFSSFIFINLVIDQINWNIDKFIIGRFHGTLSVAIYGLAAQLNGYYLSLSTTISSVFIPRIHRLVASKDSDQELSLLFTRIGRIQFLILSLIVSGFVFFGRPFMNLWAGASYDNSYFIVLLLIIPVTIPLIQNIGIEIQRAKNMHQFRSWVYLFIAIVNIVVTIPLVRLYGEIAAAAGTALSLIIGHGFIMNWYYQTKVGLDMKYFWKSIFAFFPAIIIPVFFGMSVVSIVNLYVTFNFITFGLIYVIVYLLSMWFFGMNKFEKKIIVSTFSALLRKLRD